jgi:hypothetical protein
VKLSLVRHSGSAKNKLDRFELEEFFQGNLVCQEEPTFKIMRYNVLC